MPASFCESSFPSDYGAANLGPKSKREKLLKEIRYLLLPDFVLGAQTQICVKHRNKLGDLFLINGSHVISSQLDI